MRMNISELSLQMILLLPVSFVSAAAVSYFVPRAGAVEIEADGMAQMDADLSGTKLKEGTDIHTERIVQSQWEKQRRWALVYKKRRKELQRFRVSKLTCISFGACLQVAATQVPPAWKATTALAGGVLTALGGVIKNKYVTSEHVEKMVSSFYIQQAIKSEIYKFRSKAFPYDSKNKNDALQELRSTCNSLSKGGDDKMYHTMSKDNKAIPGDMSTKELYISKRVDPRIHNFLIGNGQKMAAKGKLCSRIEDGLITAGTAIGFMSTQTLPGNLEAIVGGLTGWAAAFTTVSAAFANHHAKMKFGEIANQYFDTAEELTDVVETWPIACTKAGDPGWDDMINKCEDLIIGTTEEFAKKRTGSKDLGFAKRSKPVRVRYAEKVWNPDIVCGDDDSGSYPAKDRAIYLVETQGKTMKEAREMVMAEFPENF